MNLLLIRHAQTTWNAAGRVQGQADPPLSGAGLAQCAALEARLAGFRLDRLHSSDLERARVTAEAVARATGSEVQLEPGLREVGLGEWEGFDRERMRRDFPAEYQAWRNEPSWDIVPGGEGAAAFRARVVEAMGTIARGAGEDTTVAAVTHIGVIRMVLSIAAGLEGLGLRWPWAIDNTAITTLVGPGEVQAWGSPALQVTAVNDAQHLLDLEVAE